MGYGVSQTCLLAARRATIQRNCLRTQVVPGVSAYVSGRVAKQAVVPLKGRPGAHRTIPSDFSMGILSKVAVHSSYKIYVLKPPEIFSRAIS